MLSADARHRRMTALGGELSTRDAMHLRMLSSRFSPMSDSGSKAGATDRAQLRSGAVSMTLPRLVIWANTAHQGLCEAARQVVVLDVMGSIRSALSARVCRIRAGTMADVVDSLCLCKSGTLECGSWVVYKTAAHLTGARAGTAAGSSVRGGGASVARRAAS